MNDYHSDVLISLKPKHAENILSGEKTVELRKRRPNIKQGTTIWLYVTAPVSALKGAARVERIVTATPKAIWDKFGDRTGISKIEFDNYFANSKSAHALLLMEVKELQRPLFLSRIRELVEGFHPPQFFCRLNGATATLRLKSRKFKFLKT